ncbi:hypothetical protein BH20GEM2_BH20GEM2_21540 [soil metagenome]
MTYGFSRSKTASSLLFSSLGDEFAVHAAQPSGVLGVERYELLGWFTIGIHTASLVA